MVADIDYQPTAIYQSPFGSWGDIRTNRVALFGSEISNSNLTTLMCYYGNVQSWSVTNFKGRKIWDFNKNVYKIGTATHTFTARTFTSLYNDIIFGKAGYGGTIEIRNLKMKLYSFKIYDNDALVRDFIPVLNNNGIPCLYDRVNNEFYYNQGTGEFLYGSSTFVPLDYLESTGTQYIDTGFKPNQDSGIDIAIDTTNCVNMDYPSPFGSRGDGTSNLNTNQFLIGIQYPNGANTQNWFLRYGTLSYVGDTSFGTKYGYNRVVINKNIFTINQSSYTFNSTTFQGAYNMYLFGYNQNGQLGNGENGLYNGKIFYAKIYDNETLIRDFIPVLDSNNVQCLYDAVNNEFYYNKGTGRFDAQLLLS